MVNPQQLGAKQTPETAFGNTKRSIDRELKVLDPKDRVIYLGKVLLYLEGKSDEATRYLEYEVNDP